MASERGRGAQVILDGTAQQVARGGNGARLIDNIITAQSLIAQGAVADGNRPDGSTSTGKVAEDVVIEPMGILPGVISGATPVASSTTLAGSTISEVIDGVTVTTTLAPGTITAVYGAPINQTWVTTISGSDISTVRTV